MRGQVLVIFAFLLVILLGFTGVAIDIGRANAEQRHIQTAADAAALAACRALIDGASDNAAAAEARTVAAINIERSPSGTIGVIAPDIAKGYEDGHAGDPAYLRSGVIVGGDLGSGGHLLDRRHDPGPRGRHPHAGRQRQGTLHVAGRTGGADRRPPL